jgi:hypothetical protein
MEKHKVAVIPTRLAVAMLLAAALFLIEAGVAEIMLASEATCREGLTYQRLAPLPEDTCLPDWQSYMLRAVSRGVVGLLFPNAPALLATLTMAVIYILIGGACSQMTMRWGIALFATSQVALTALLAGLLYVAQYIG